ncbi:MAG: MBL fold metallo-hydrolase [Haloglomus sp.]
MCAHELGTSDWGDWLPRDVAEADPDGVDIWYLGCNGFVLKAADGTTVLIDPYCGLGDPPRTVRMIPVPFDPDAFADIVDPDAVLATHEHADHVHEETQAPLVAGGAMYFAPDDSIAVVEEEDWITRDGVDDADFETVAEGDTIGVGSLTVQVEPAHDPDATHPVSYVIEHEAGRFFHGGDARPGDAFDSVGDRYDIDLGALAFGSSGMLADKETREPTYTRWYSSPNDIAEAAAQLELDRLLPSHWDVWKGLTADPRSVRDHARSFVHPRAVEVVELGDRVSL